MRLSDFAQRLDEGPRLDRRRGIKLVKQEVQRLMSQWQRWIGRMGDEAANLTVEDIRAFMRAQNYDISAQEVIGQLISNIEAESPPEAPAAGDTSDSLDTDAIFTVEALFSDTWRALGRNQTPPEDPVARALVDNIQQVFAAVVKRAARQDIEAFVQLAGSRAKPAPSGGRSHGSGPFSRAVGLLHGAPDDRGPRPKDSDPVPRTPQTGLPPGELRGLKSALEAVAQDKPITPSQRQAIGAFLKKHFPGE